MLFCCALPAPSCSHRVACCRDYFAFEFLQKSARFTRHVVAVATVANGKLILFTTGAKEARWGKMKDKLTKSVESFKAFNVYK